MSKDSLPHKDLLSVKVFEKNKDYFQITLQQIERLAPQMLYRRIVIRIHYIKQFLDAGWRMNQNFHHFKVVSLLQDIDNCRRMIKAITPY
jgi:radical SAM superfamily enzyme